MSRKFNRRLAFGAVIPALLGGGLSSALLISGRRRKVRMDRARRACRPGNEKGRTENMKNTLKMLLAALLCCALLCGACALAENNKGLDAAKALVPADAALRETEKEGPYTEYTFFSASEQAEYEVYVDAAGKVVRLHLDYENRKPGVPGRGAGKLSADQAKEALIALEPDAVVTSVLEETDDGGVQYRIVYTLPDGAAGVAELDAVTGVLLEKDVAFAPELAGIVGLEGKADMTENEARTLILSKVTNGRILEFERDRDDGRVVYEGKVSGSEGVYEFQIDVATGVITEWEIDD